MFVGKRYRACALPVPRDALNVSFWHIRHDWGDESVSDLTCDPFSCLGYDELMLSKDHMWAVLLGSSCSDDDRGCSRINLVRYLHPGQFIKENRVGYLCVSDGYIDEESPY